MIINAPICKVALMRLLAKYCILIVSYGFAYCTWAGDIEDLLQVTGCKTKSLELVQAGGRSVQFEHQVKKEDVFAGFATLNCSSKNSAMEPIRDYVERDVMTALPKLLAYNYDIKFEGQCRVLDFGTYNQGGLGTLKFMVACPPGDPISPDDHN